MIPAVGMPAFSAASNASFVLALKLPILLGGCEATAAAPCAAREAAPSSAMAPGPNHVATAAVEAGKRQPLPSTSTRLGFGAGKNAVADKPKRVCASRLQKATSTDPTKTD